MRRAAQAIGSPWTLVALALIVATGIPYGFSDTWMKWSNFGLSIAAIVAAVIVQNAQNTDTAALQSKSDEIIKALPEADNALQGIEKR